MGTIENKLFQFPQLRQLLSESIDCKLKISMAYCIWKIHAKSFNYYSHVSVLHNKNMFLHNFKGRNKNWQSLISL